MGQLQMSGKIRVSQGKMVYEIYPTVDWNKGKAISWIIGQYLDKKAKRNVLTIFLGDDLTDEVGFNTVEKYNGISIFIGVPSEQYSARYFLNNSEEVTELLRRML